jgi:putative ABC transport system permease protein
MTITRNSLDSADSGAADHGHHRSAHRRATAHGGAAATAPWRRAPLLLLRRPVVFLAIVGAACILAIAAASGPLFLSTIGTASLHAQAEQSCPEDAQPTATAMVGGTQLSSVSADGIRAFDNNGLTGAYVSADGYAHIGPSLVHLYSRSDALDHVTRITPNTGARGVWLPDTLANKLDAKPGGTVTTAAGKRLPVAGIYRDLAPNPYALSHLSRYWCHYTNQIVSTVAADGAIAATPPRQRQGAWLIADPATVGRASEDAVEVLWSRPMSTETNPLTSFDRAADRVRTAAGQIHGVYAQADPDLRELAGIAHTGRKGITGSILPIEIAGVIVACLLVGGAGMFWATARQREIRLLVARGVGPVPLAGKAVLETVVPALIGAAIGTVATSYVGPSRALESDAPLRATVLVAVALLIGLLVIAVIGGLAGRDRTTGRQASWLRLVPWEVGLLAAAIALAVTHHGKSAVSVDHTVVHISPVVVMYPLLGATAALLLVGRIVGAMLPGIARSSARRRTTPYLALRRLGRSRAVAIGVLIGTALPCCLLMYGSTVTDTVSHDVTRKYQTNLGAPHVLQVYGVHDRLFDPQGHGTQVVIYRQQVVLGNDTPSYVLGVDPKTFGEFAFLDEDQRAALAKLAHPSTGGPIPAIIVNAAGMSDTNRVHIGSTPLLLDEVASTAVFPGLRNSNFPMVVVDQRALAKVDASGAGLNSERLNQFWTDVADYGAARHLIERNGFSVLFELTSDVVVGTTGLLPVTWLFGYLRALAVLIGVVAIAGLVFGLAARTRRRRVSYVLSRRMGMSKAAHLNSLLIELTLIIGLGWVAGSGLGLGSFGVVYGAFDVYPALAPPPDFAVPTQPIQLTALIAASIVVLAAAATHLLAERTRPAEILRLE